jgi:hypothetical protein
MVPCTGTDILYGCFLGHLESSKEGDFFFKKNSTSEIKIVVITHCLGVEVSAFKI